MAFYLLIYIINDKYVRIKTREIQIRKHRKGELIMKIKFLGAATSVTGSCYLITTKTHKFIIDCGLFQGNKTIESQNREEFGFDPTDIDFMILSHAHIDHSGRIPLLVKKGFKGKIYCTNATADLVDIMLKDSGYIQEREAEWGNKKAQRLGRPLVDPLYTMEDATKSLKQIEPYLYEQNIQIDNSVKFRFRDAGHILGSAIVEIWVEEDGKVNKLVFSGDLGMKNKPILNNPVFIEEADYLIMEATYGNRKHETIEESLEEFIDIIVKTIKRGGTVVIPSFAVGRTQELIYQLNMYYEHHEEFKEILKNIMVYIDSPLAISATEIFRRNAQDFDEETRKHILSGDNPLDFKNLVFVRESRDSKELNFNDEPKIIIASSGMAEAGRIKHHLKHHLWKETSSVVIVGYQAAGTLGRSLVERAEEVFIFGEKIKIKAEVYSLEGFSGHADKDGLFEWISSFKKFPKKVFLVHGEDESKIAFAERIKDELNHIVQVIDEVSEFDLATDEGEPAELLVEKRARCKDIIRLRRKLEKIQSELDHVVNNANGILDRGIKQEKLEEISNMTIDLEETMINLGTIVTKNE
jgi:metallo-beta-lactamase family protein